MAGPVVIARTPEVLDDPGRFLDEIVVPGQPVVVRGAFSAWPAVRAGSGQPAAFRAYLARFAGDATVEMFVGDPAIGGRYTYAEGLAGFNFTRETIALRDAIDRIFATADVADAPTVYVGSLETDRFMPGFAAENRTVAVPASVGSRIWLGHASHVSCHNDTYDNLACVIAGRRRFTLYPPEVVGELYVGPIDHTMAGRPVSLADGSAAGDSRYPRFEAIRDKAIVVELAPGDALYLPKLWWHRVEATGLVNGLVNYWWDAFGQGPDAPYTTMMLAMTAIAERPAAERAAWRALFDHYVFRPDGHPLAHLPEDRHGILGPLRETRGRIRALVMKLLRGG